MNYQNRGLCYLPKPKAEADNTDTRQKFSIQKLSKFLIQKLSKFTTEFVSDNKYMNFVCWNEELNAKNIFSVKDEFKDETGCHRKQLNRVTGWQELLFPLRKMRKSI